MATIALEGMQFHAHHGFYEEERQVGNRFTVNVWVETNFSQAWKEDNIKHTVNYEHIYNIVRSEMTQPARLLENVVERIIQHFESKHGELIEQEQVNSMTVQLVKHRPPLAGVVDKAVITKTENFNKHDA